MQGRAIVKTASLCVFGLGALSLGLRTPLQGTPPFTQRPGCAPSIEDQSGAGCLQASSSPALGQLYPLSDKLCVTSSGNVGLGTTTPGTRLEVAGTVLSKANFGTLRMTATGGVTADYYWQASPGTGSCYLRDAIDQAYRIYVTAGGFVGIGTDSPSSRLDVAGETTTNTLRIRGGADVVEGFDSGGVDIESGMVVVLDPTNEGRVVRSNRSYDPTVIGVVSGAGGVLPGLHLGQAGVMDGTTLVAVSGRVNVRCTAENGHIRRGDLLTTAATPGHAMRVTDACSSAGAIIGKALSSLEGEEGLVLLLVGLQ